jgi:hypothetical protein
MACSSLKIVDRSPSFGEHFSAKFRNLIGFHRGVTDRRDQQHFLIEQTQELLQNHLLRLSRFHDEATQALVILDSHVRSLGKVIGDGLSEKLQRSGNAVNLYNLLDVQEHPSKEQFHAAALHLVRDIRSLITRLQLDLSSFDAASTAMGLLKTSHALSAREILRALIVRCHVIRKGLMGQIE